MIRSLIPLQRKTGIATLDPVRVATDAMTRYNERVTNYTDTVLNTFNEATENAPKARDFSKNISATAV